MALGLSLLFAGALPGLAGTGSEAGLQVQESTGEVLRFTLEGLDLQWSTRDLREGRVQMDDPSLPGFLTAGDPGQPRVPRRGGWFIVPPGTRPVLVTLKEEWRPEGGQRVLVQGVPVMVPGVESGSGSLGEILVLPGEELPADVQVAQGVRRRLSQPTVASSGEAVQLGEVRWWRGRRIASWTMVGLQHDAQGRARQSLQGGTWEIRFVADKSSQEIDAARSGLKTTTHGDQQLGGGFLNGNLLQGLPTEASARGIFPRRPDALKSQGGKSGTLLGNMEGRLAVNTTGLFKVTASLVSQLGYIPGSGVQESEIRLYQRRYLERLDDGSGQAPYVEIEVPIHMVGDGGEFSGDDYFLFYGLRLRDDGAFTADVGQGDETIPGCGDPYEKNNNVNIYWLAAATPDAGESWARMATETLAPSSGNPLAGYRRTDRFETAGSFRENLPSESMDPIVANHETNPSATLSLTPWSPDPEGADAHLEVAFSGYQALDRDLLFEFIDSNEVSTVLEEFTHELGWGSDQRGYDIAAGDFALAPAKFHMTSPQSTTQVKAFLNWVEATYDALYQAVDGELPFHTGLAGGPVDIEVTGFTSADLGLVRVDDPRHPVWVSLGGSNVVADGEGYRLSLRVDNPVSVSSRFYAAQDMGDSDFQPFAYYESSRAEDQVNPTEYSGGGNPDLVVVAHEEFMSAVPRWVQHRQQRAGGDLDVLVVDVQDLYDWYSGGLRDAWAIKRFANHAIEVWGSYAFVLIGDANENARELDIKPAAREWSIDWVPTHYHTQQAITYLPELMASDKWYATHQAGQNYPVEDFPNTTYSPWEMYVGRLPCNSVDELNLMIDKIIAVETPANDEDWRRRAILFGDDQWSNDPNNPAYLEYNTDELVFTESLRDSLAPMWRNGSGVTLTTTELYLGTYLDPYWEGQGLADRRATLFKNYTLSDATPPLLAALSAGALVNLYQGHANAYVLASENWFVDRLGPYRNDMEQVNNPGKPWFFIGLGCHISDWAQTATFSIDFPRERSLSEKFMVLPGGAFATYGSPGYEYILNNHIFGEAIFNRWLRQPPSGLVGPSGGSVRSRWVLGELMWAAEADILAILGATDSYREMVAQYGLLGDPLMILDTGPAQVSASFTDGGGEAITGTELDLVAVDASNTRHIRLVATDEAGIDRLEVMDDQGNDLTQQVSTETLPAGAGDHQVVTYDLELPVNPYDHALTVRVYDTGGWLATDRHYELVLNVNQVGEFMAGGEIVDPDVFEFTPGEPVAFSATFTGATWFHDGLAMELSSTSLDISDVQFTLDKSNEMSVDFTATAPVGTYGERSVDLTIGDFPATTYVLQSGGSAPTEAGISTVYNFPNPVSEGTRFLFTTDAGAARGVVRVFNVAGRHVARIPFVYEGGGNMVVTWDGRDDDGDELGNGTYLYRVELETAGQALISDMQRLVVMR